MTLPATRSKLRKPASPAAPARPPSLAAGLRLLLGGDIRGAPGTPAGHAHAVPPPRLARAFRCRCGRPVFFANSACLGCGAQLGYDVDAGRLRAIEPAEGAAWRDAGPPDAPEATARRWLRCAALDGASGCNWLVGVDEADAGVPPRCRCCRLLRRVADLAQPDNAAWFRAIERERRRLVASLVGLGLPVQPRHDDGRRPFGLAFDLLRGGAGGPSVVTGHADGVITLDLEEADEALREQRRRALREPYRTLLGHLRHESGHYYWQRLVEPEPGRLAAFRALFGDERADYAAALAAHHAQGAPADWSARAVSAYACAHPWEDWAETWAHYLLLTDTLDTARSYGIDGERVALDCEPFTPEQIGAGAEAAPFLALVRNWVELTGVLNELSRAMGLPDFYPFVLSATAVRKLHFVHRVVVGDGAATPR